MSSSGGDPLDPAHPVWRHPLELAVAPEKSDHGLPMADGMVGVSVWGNGQPLVLSLDRADLWDLREIPEYQGEEYSWLKVAAAHRAGQHDHLIQLLEAPYGRAGPTRLSAGRLVLTFPSQAESWRYERATGQVLVSFKDGATLEAIITASGSLGRLRVRGASPELKLVSPPFGGPPEHLTEAAGPLLSRHNAWDLGYPAAERFETPGETGFVQSCGEDFAFAIAVARSASDSCWQAVWHIAIGRSDDNGLWSRARDAARDVLQTDFHEDADRAATWWADYWSRGVVSLPDPVLEDIYYSGMAQFGAVARRGCPPASLQGLWTTDDGLLPPWKGDYHHDLNTQMTYWPCYAGNQLSAGLGFLDWLWETRETCRDWTSRFFGVAGLNVPMTADLHNRQIGGWRQYTHSVSTGAWLAHHFYLHWRHSGDDVFLVERGYPYLREVCEFVEAISRERDERGFRSIALSSSPEVGDNRPEAWFESFTNYDLTLFRWVLGAAAEMAEAAARPDDAMVWREVVGQFPQLATTQEGELLVGDGVTYPGHHRHFSHAIAIHPLAMLSGIDGSFDERRVAIATVGAIGRASRDFWMGYSHAWFAALAARIGDGALARQSLRDFAAAFVFPNGFHANGDWKMRGYGKAPFGAFTLEGAMGAADAIQTMLLQSSPGKLRLFPAIPPDWTDVGFDEMRADGGIRVSAALQGRKLTRVVLRSEANGALQLAAFDLKSAASVRLIAGQAVELDAELLALLTSAAPVEPLRAVHAMAATLTGNAP